MIEERRYYSSVKLYILLGKTRAYFGYIYYVVLIAIVLTFMIGAAVYLGRSWWAYSVRAGYPRTQALALTKSWFSGGGRLSSAL